MLKPPKRRGNTEKFLLIINLLILFLSLYTFAYFMGKGIAKERVKGSATISITEDTKAAVLSKPSVVKIVNKFCAKLAVKTNGTLKLSKEVYPFCATSSGSGFFVSENGFIATSGHVAKILAKDAISSALAKGELNTLASDYSASKRLEGDSVSELTRKILAEVEAGNLEVLSEEEILTTQFGKSRSEESITARLVDYEYEDINNMSKGFRESDIALLKIEGHGFPALPLGLTEDLRAGQKLFVIGYPTVVDNQNLVDKNERAATVTSGVISSIKRSSGNLKRLIQTDASLSQGNSGGPAVNNEGVVIGIASYSLSQKNGNGNFNFLRDVKDLSGLMAQNSVQSEDHGTYEAWKNAINHLLKDDYENALEDLYSVKKMSPNHPDVDEFISAVAPHSSSAPLLSKIPSSEGMLLLGTGVSLITAILSLAITFLLIKKILVLEGRLGIRKL